ncbi:MAG: DNA primase [Gemmatimonadetes bacterium]|nr:DNA primase [Gemmatimonadota bacterium]MYD12557.1 DNA primase [Gemmatimonadota bacterium]MYI66199.1 DNA primase [Gemmatimonadota bacterium]
MIPDHVVEEVRARADIVGIIGNFVQLKKAGKDFRGLSPFKKEKTPSFFVIPAKAFFHDFSSGESGDVFSFLMKHQGMSFTDAVKYVGARSGVEVKEVRRGRKSDDPWRPYYEASTHANAFFQERLWEWDGGTAAREYLERRGISRETGERFGLGYAPDEWGALRDAASALGIGEGILLELGLLKKSEKRERLYDAFRNRVIFPIESVSGRVLAFGGRLLGPEGKGAPKYLNSPESPIFHKGEVLYGLSWAGNHIRRQGAALLVEGFMDALSLAAVGVANAVAPLGTALTEAHARLLGRYTKQVRILFDNDAAGLRATFRAADTLLARGLHAAVVTLPEGEDPDSVARDGGAQAVQGFVGEAVDVLDRKIAILEEHDYFSSIEKTRSALDRLLPTLRAVTDPRLRDIYLTRVAERTGVRADTLEAEMRGGARPRPARATTAQTPRQRPLPRFRGLGPDWQLVHFILKRRDWIERAGERVGPSDLEDDALRAIFEWLIDDPELAAPPEGAMPEAVQRFEELSRSRETPPDEVFEDVARGIDVRTIDRRLEALDIQMRGTVEEVEKRRLFKDKDELNKEKRALGADWRRSTHRAAGTTQRKGEGAR